MKKVILIVLALCMTQNLMVAQLIDGFEEFELSENSFLNGSTVSGEFIGKGITLPNDYNAEFDSWQGWSISNVTDDETPGFTNQYSAITGSGHDGSSNYAVSFQFAQNIIRVNDGPQVVEGLYITNSTYAFLSMRDGDPFAKKFGGATGDDEDYFLVTIEGFKAGEQVDTFMNFMLADYRFDDSSEDYILDEWTWMDLSFLGEVDSIGFSLSSSDNGEFGMNTPAYFCIDDVTLQDLTSSLASVPIENQVTIFPNPSTSFLNIKGLKEGNSTLTIFRTNGQLVFRQEIQNSSSTDISQLEKGMYFLEIRNKDIYESMRFIKN